MINDLPRETVYRYEYAPKAEYRPLYTARTELAQLAELCGVHPQDLLINLLNFSTGPRWVVKMLGVSRSTVYRWIERYDITRVWVPHPTPAGFDDIHIPHIELLPEVQCFLDSYYWDDFNGIIERMKDMDYVVRGYQDWVLPEDWSHTSGYVPADEW